MDPSTLHQYRFLLLLLGAGLAAGVPAAALLRRMTPASGGYQAPAQDPTRVSPWRDALALIVAIGTSVMLFYLLPAGLVFRFFQTWQSVVFLVVFAAAAALPGVYAVRSGVL